MSIFGAINAGSDLSGAQPYGFLIVGQIKEDIIVNRPLGCAKPQWAFDWRRNRNMKYDILLKGGTVIDAAQGLNAVRDVAIAGGVIAAIEPDIPIDAATQTVSVKDKYVTPGLVDIHTHVYYGVTTWGIRADTICPMAGTTTVVDAGSPSWVTFPGFREFIAEPAQTNILTYIHISGIGLVYGPVGEMFDMAYADPGRVAETLQQHRDITVGVKVRQGKGQVGDNGVEPLKLAHPSRRARRNVCHVPYRCRCPAPRYIEITASR